MEALPNFLEIFNAKLQSVESFTDDEAKDRASWYKDPEIFEITKEIPAVIFCPEDFEKSISSPTDIWIEDPKDLDMGSDYIHSQVVRKLDDALNRSDTPTTNFISGYILEDNKGTRYLVLDAVRATMLRHELKSAKDFNESTDLAIFDLLNRYKIRKVLENYLETEKTETGSSSASKTKDVVSKNVLEKRREDMALLNLARKHGMTNSQYLRLKILADTLSKTGQQVSLEEISRSIVKDEDGETIPVRHLPLAE